MSSKITAKDIATAAEKRRQRTNSIVLWISTIFAFIAIAFLFWILGTLVYKGIGAINFDVFTKDMAPPMSTEGGGLRNAIVGQMILTFGATAIGVPIGVLAGTWLREYGGNSRFANFVRDISDVMMSAPSIVIAVYIYAVFVVPTGGFSGMAGMLALAVMMLPIVLRTTDDMLSMVSSQLREAAIALGAPKYKMIIQVVYRGAKVGMLTGIILAIARIAGEAAPLLFTSLNSTVFTVNFVDGPFPSLTVTMFDYAMSSYDDWKQLGWAAAFILAAFILILNILGRFVINKKRGR